jgi:hypothetical protein
VDHLDHVRLSGHDGLDVFIALRSLVDHSLVLVTGHAFCVPDQILYSQGIASFGPRHDSSGSVRAGVESLSVALPLNQERFGPHGTRNDPHLAILSTHGPLAGEPHFLPSVLLPVHVVVVAADLETPSVKLGEFPSLGQIPEGVQHADHHDGSVLSGVVLSPVYPFQVVVEGFGPLEEIGQSLVL